MERHIMWYINELSAHKDKDLAKLIRENKIDGMMLMSCDPKGVNKESILAAFFGAIDIHY